MSSPLSLFFTHSSPETSGEHQEAPREVQRAKPRRQRRASYTWHPLTGDMEWEGEGLVPLGVPASRRLNTIAGFKALIVPEHLTRWHETVLAVPSDRASVTNAGTAYRVEYRFTPSGRPGDASIWIEESGRCWFGADGKPARVRGTCRLVTTDYLETRRRMSASSKETDQDANRIRLFEQLQIAIERSVALRQPCAFLLVSVDTLAAINSKFGFDIGDEVLGAVERILSTKLREGDVLGRYSPHKFGILINDCSQTALGIVSRRLIDAVKAARLETSVCQLTTSISIGAVSIPEYAATVPETLSRALEAHDEAQGMTGNALVIFNPSSARETPRQRNARVAGSIFDAIDEKRMLFVLQPIIDAATGKAEMFECLLRMRTQEGTLVSAGEFIGIAEELRLVRLIDHHTLELAVDLLKTHPHLKLSLNVSGLTVTDHDWIVALYRLTNNQRSILNRLMIEITETAMLEGLEAAKAFVDVLRDIGCKVAIDDFGAGYTSIRHLREITVDVLKIDGEFVKRLPADEQGAVFVKSMVDIAKSLNVKTVAEWVPNAEAADLLKSIGVDYLQGFHFGEPFIPEDLTKRYA